MCLTKTFPVALFFAFAAFGCSETDDIKLTYKHTNDRLFLTVSNDENFSICFRRSDLYRVGHIANNGKIFYPHDGFYIYPEILEMPAGSKLGIDFLDRDVRKVAGNEIIKLKMNIDLLDCAIMDLNEVQQSNKVIHSYIIHEVELMTTL